MLNFFSKRYDNLEGLALMRFHIIKKVKNLAKLKVIIFKPHAHIFRFSLWER